MNAFHLLPKVEINTQRRCLSKFAFLQISTYGDLVRFFRAHWDARRSCELGRAA